MRQSADRQHCMVWVTLVFSRMPPLASVTCDLLMGVPFCRPHFKATWFSKSFFPSWQFLCPFLVRNLPRLLQAHCDEYKLMRTRCSCKRYRLIMAKTTKASPSPHGVFRTFTQNPGQDADGLHLDNYITAD